MLSVCAARERPARLLLLCLPSFAGLLAPAGSITSPIASPELGAPSAQGGAVPTRRDKPAALAGQVSAAAVAWLRLLQERPSGLLPIWIFVALRPSHWTTLQSRRRPAQRRLTSRRASAAAARSRLRVRH